MTDKSAFDRHVVEYDSWFEKYPHVYAAELKAIRQLMPAQAKGLEVGTGTGRFAIPLGIQTGVEPSATMRAFTKQYNLSVVNAVAEALPFADHQFDFVLYVTVDCFLDSLEQAYQEAHRVLRNDGVILVAMLNRQSKIVEQYEKHKHNSHFYRHARFHYVTEITEVLSRCGFGEFQYRETLFNDLAKITLHEDIRTGFSTGAFVVIRGHKI